MHEHLSSVLHILLRSCPLYDVLIDCLHHCVCLYIRPKLRRCSVLSRRRASSWTRTSTGRWIIYCAVPAHNVDLAVAGLSVCVSECVDSLDCPGRCARALAFAENSLKVAASPRGFASRPVRACWTTAGHLIHRQTMAAPVSQRMVSRRRELERYLLVCEYCSHRPPGRPSSQLFLSDR